MNFLKSENVRTPAMRSSSSEMPYFIWRMSPMAKTPSESSPRSDKRGFIGDFIGFDAVVHAQVLDDVAFDVVCYRHNSL